MSIADFKTSSAVKQIKPVVRATFGLNAPDKYHSLHKPLNKVSESSNLGELFSNGRGSHNVPLVDRRPRWILPGIHSFEPRMRKFLDECVTEWNRSLPVDLDESGFTRTGIHATFDKLRCPAGYLQTPMSAKVVDNSLLREEMGLSRGYSARQRLIASAVWSHVWSMAKPSSVNVPKKSAGGMRRFTHDVQWKLDYALWKTEPSNYARYLSLVEEGDALSLANDFEIVFGMYVQKRLQLDEPSKVRLANDWEYALSGGRKGNRSETNKRVVIDGTEWTNFSGLRVRVIDAGPWAINCDLQIIATAHMRSLFERYPSTFHVNTDEEITSTVDGKYVFCSDVSEYDQSMSADALSVVFETMREYYPEGIVRSAERLYEAPYFAKPLSMDGKQGRWIHSPMDWSFSMRSGNRSGHAMTSLVAKVNKVIDTLFIFDLMYGVLPGNFHKWLSGQMPMGCVNNGDDEIIWALARKDRDRFKELRSDLGNGHYKVEPEIGNGYSGKLLVLVEDEPPKYKPTSRLQTPIEKMYVPERDIDSALRPFWPIGWFDRIDSLASTDAGRQLWDIHNFHFRKHLAEDGNLMDILQKAYRRMGLQLGGLSDADREVLVDPDKLHYKYSIEDIDPNVISMVTSRIPADYSAGFLRKWYSGVLH